jgi:hypothetical protein
LKNNVYFDHFHIFLNYFAELFEKTSVKTIKTLEELLVGEISSLEVVETPKKVKNEVVNVYEVVNKDTLKTAEKLIVGESLVIWFGTGSMV